MPRLLSFEKIQQASCMKKHFLSGSVFVAFGVIVVALSRFILPFCSATTPMTMRCHFSQTAETFAGAFILALGVLTLLTAQRKVQILFATLVFVSNVLVSLIPTVIIGTCPKIHMHCHSISAPVLFVVGILFAIASVFFLIGRIKSDSIQK